MSKTENEGMVFATVCFACAVAALVAVIIALAKAPTPVDAPPPMIPATWAPIQPPHPELECWLYDRTVVCRSTTEECP